MIHKDFAHYQVELIDEEFRKTSVIMYPQTALISLFDSENKLLQVVERGYLPIEEVYERLENELNEVLNFDYCYIKNFSLKEYRKRLQVPDKQEVDLWGFSAQHSWFDADESTDFSYAQFGDNDTAFDHCFFTGGYLTFEESDFGNGSISFEHAFFHNGNVSFRNTVFGMNDVSFKNATFREGRKEFDRADFGDGQLLFVNVDFGDGDVLFTGISSNSGRVSFMMAIFGTGRIDFSYIKLGYGELSFERAKFGDGDVIFKSSYFNEGKVDFTRATFGKGKKDFSHTDFGKGNVSFLYTSFGDGKLTFKLTLFGNGEISFHFALFGHCDVLFDRTAFGDGLIDFRAVVFNGGRIVFRRTTFGNGTVTFEASRLTEGKMLFENCFFGKGDFYFMMVEYETTELIFNHVDFGDKSVSFNMSRFLKLAITDCHINNYFDIKLAKCHSLNLSDTIVRDIIDIRFLDEEGVEKFNLTGIRLLGRIYIDWHEYDLKRLIYQQNTTFREKSEQFRTLKQNYNSIGQYTEEDEAYVEFKRTELKADFLERKKRASENLHSKIIFHSVCEVLKKEKLLDEKHNDLLINILDENSLAFVDTNEDLKNIVYKEIGDNKALFQKLNTALSNPLISNAIRHPSFRAKQHAYPIYWRQRSTTHISYWIQFILFDKVGMYATNPLRVLSSMFVAYAAFSILYIILYIFPDSNINSSLFSPHDPRQLSMVGKAFYHSAVTFLTIGYGDYYPSGIHRAVSGIEGLVGMFLMSYFTVAFVRKILR